MFTLSMDSLISRRNLLEIEAILWGLIEFPPSTHTTPPSGPLTAFTQSRWVRSNRKPSELLMRAIWDDLKPGKNESRAGMDVLTLRSTGRYPSP